MMKNCKKYLTINLRYTDELEFIRGLEAIRKQIMAYQTNHSSGSFGDVSFDWHYQYEQFADYREEQINGVWYRIYPSKMNKNE